MAGCEYRTVHLENAIDRAFPHARRPGSHELAAQWDAIAADALEEQAQCELHDAPPPMPTDAATLEAIRLALGALPDDAWHQLPASAQDWAFGGKVRR